MCYNTKISLNTFIYAIISAIIVFLLNEIDNGLILITLSVSIMQLLEYFTWKYIDNKRYNYYLSIIGSLIILLQIILINHFNLYDKNERIIAFTIIFIGTIYIYYYIFTNNLFYMDVGKNGHLVWHYTDIPWFILLIIFILYTYPFFRAKRFIGGFVVLISLFISLYFYYKYKTWGSMWCYMTNILWIGLIMRSLHYKYIKYIKQ
jgi:hypothetical protein